MSLEYLKQADIDTWDFPSEFDILDVMAAKRKYQGAHVEVFKRGIFRGTVTHIDCRSMYAMIMTTLNISPESTKFVKLKDHTGQYIYSPTYIEVPDERLGKQLVVSVMPEDSVTRKLMIYIFNKRQEVRKAGGPLAESQQLGLKLIGNALYGYNGMEFARYGSYLVSIIAAATGRFIIEAMIKWLQGRGFEPLEVDTDGIYVLGAIDITELIEYVRGLFARFPLAHMLTLDSKTYEGMIVIKMKNYVLRRKGKNHFTGSGLRGRSVPPICIKALEDLCAALFENRDLYATWADCLDRLTSTRLNDFEMSAEVGKDPDEYVETTMYAKLYSQLPDVEWGDEIRYVKTTEGYLPLGIRDNDEVLKILDAPYYRERIRKVADRLIAPLLGTDSTVDAFHEAAIKKKKKPRRKKKDDK